MRGLITHMETFTALTLALQQMCQYLLAKPTCSINMHTDFSNLNCVAQLISFQLYVLVRCSTPGIKRWYSDLDSQTLGLSTQAPIYSDGKDGLCSSICEEEHGVMAEGIRSSQTNRPQTLPRFLASVSATRTLCLSPGLGLVESNNIDLLVCRRPASCRMIRSPAAVITIDTPPKPVFARIRTNKGYFKKQVILVWVTMYEENPQLYYLNVWNTMILPAVLFFILQPSSRYGTEEVQVCWRRTVNITD